MLGFDRSRLRGVSFLRDGVTTSRLSSLKPHTALKFSDGAISLNKRDVGMAHLSYKLELL